MPKGGSGRGSGVHRSAALERALASIESKISTRKTEKLILADEDGNIVLQKSGGKNGVKVAVSDLPLMNGKTLTHNHPDEGTMHTTFSTTDIDTAIKYGLKEMRAVNEVSQVSFALNKNSPLKTSIALKKRFIAGHEKVLSRIEDKISALDRKMEQRNVAFAAGVRTRTREQLAIYEKEYLHYTKQRAALEAEKYTKTREYLRNNQLKYGYSYSERKR